MKPITIYTRSVYGRTLVYPANAEQARYLSLLTGAKTLEHRHLQGLEGLGIRIEVVADPASKPAWLSPENVRALQS